MDVQHVQFPEMIKNNQHTIFIFQKEQKFYNTKHGGEIIETKIFNKTY